MSPIGARSTRLEPGGRTVAAPSDPEDPARRTLPGTRRIAIAGTLSAGFVAYLTAQNPYASPQHLAAAGRAVVILTLLLAGLYARMDGARVRLGAVLLWASLFSALWLLNGSSNSLAFTIGVVFSSLAPAVACGLLLAHPRGTLRTRGEARFLAGGALVMGLTALILLLTRPSLPLVTPLLQCGTHCPRNLLYTGASTPLAPVLKAVLVTGWLTLTVGTGLLLARRVVRATPPARRMLAPIALTAALSALALLGFFLARVAGPADEGVFGAAYVATMLLVPVAIFLGLSLERLFIGDALARLVDELAGAAPERVAGADGARASGPDAHDRLPARGCRGYLDAAASPSTCSRPRAGAAAAGRARWLPRRVGDLRPRAGRPGGASCERPATAAMMWLRTGRAGGRAEGLDGGAHELAPAARATRRMPSASGSSATSTTAPSSTSWAMRVRLGAGGGCDRRPTASAASGVLAEMRRGAGRGARGAAPLAQGVYPPLLAGTWARRGAAGRCGAPCIGSDLARSAKDAAG